MFGLGASFVWFPCISAPQEWFSSRRGLAIGITMCGSGIGGLVMSNINQAVILSLDYRWALRISGFISFFFLILATVFVKSPRRRSEQEKQTIHDMLRRQIQLLKNTQFDILLIVGFITTFGYLVKKRKLFLTRNFLSKASFNRFLHFYYPHSQSL